MKPFTVSENDLQRSLKIIGNVVLLMTAWTFYQRLEKRLPLKSGLRVIPGR